MATDNEGFYEVVSPRGRNCAPIIPPARRLDSLDGKRVAQLWDFVFRGDEIYEILEEGLRKRYPKIEFVSWREFGNTHGNDERGIVERLPQRLAELKVDAVISGVGA